MSSTQSAATWTTERINALFEQPFNDLLFAAHTAHRQQFDPNKVQVSTLLSIKTGACPEDCAYCPQSVHYQTGLEREALMPVDAVLDKAKTAQDKGATRFCMGAAWRGEPREKDFQHVLEMIEGVKALGLESCATLGMLSAEKVKRLKEAGLDYYNHNLDTSPEYYEKIISTRTYQDRLETLARVREAGIHVCCGGIVGMGESRADRVELLRQLVSLPEPPESVPINHLIRIEGTPLAEAEPLDLFEFVRTIAVARLLLPTSYVRLSAGRDSMSDELQALCFFAGANSIFYGETLLTADNPSETHDQKLMTRLGIMPESLKEKVSSLDFKV